MSQAQHAGRAGLNRRQFFRSATLAGLGALGAGGLAPALAQTLTMPFVNGERRLVKFPQKRDLILLTMRPPQLETPFSVFDEGIFTPNDAFFVRYHMSQIPTAIDPEEFRLELKGNVRTALSLSLADLKEQFEPVEIVAVNQCSGNGRGFSTPRVGGGQSGNGTMGCARWKGVRLKDVLARAGLGAGARQVSFNGMDTPVSEKTPDFVKALDVDHALDGEVMLAYEMNREDLPMLNGFPLRLVVPGYYGTYWMKHLNEIQVLNEEFSGFWMSTGYRIPDNPTASCEPGTTPSATKPIARLNVRSFITSLAEGGQVTVGRPLTVRGIAFDGGDGIREVRFSEDGGKSWRETTLGHSYGKYSFREWTAAFKPSRSGVYELKACATTGSGQTQPLEARWNPAGYMRNVVETVRVTAA